MAGIAATAGWQAAGFAAAAVGATVLLILFWRRSMLTNAAAEQLVVPSHAEVVQAAGVDKGPQQHQLSFLRSTAVWLCFAFFFFTTAAFGILQNYSPAILGNVYSMSLVAATGGLTAYLLGSAAGTITGGFLASRNDRNDRLIAIALGFSALMALLLASGQIAAALVFPTMALMGFGVGSSGPNRDLLVRRAATSQFGKRAFGRIYGFVYSGLDIGLAMSPLAFGPLLDAGKFQAALVAVARTAGGGVVYRDSCRYGRPQSDGRRLGGYSVRLNAAKTKIAIAISNANARQPCLEKSAPDSLSRKPENPPTINESDPSLAHTPEFSASAISTIAIAVSVKPSIRRRPIREGALSWIPRTFMVFA